MESKNPAEEEENVKFVPNNDAALSKEKDQIIDAIGEIGPWQLRRICFLFLFKACLALPNMGITFFSARTDFWCQRPDSETLVPVEEWRNMSSPLILNSDGEWHRDQCHIWNSEDFKQPLDNGTKPCTSWEYDRSVYTNTIIHDFDLVCQNRNKKDWAQSSYFTGFLIGMAVSGSLSDYFGRMRTIVPLLMGMCTFGTLSAFSTTVEWFMVTRFLQGCCHSVGIVFCWTVELVGGKWQTIIGMSNWGPWVLGIFLTAAVSAVAPDWRHYQLITSVPVYVTVIFYCILPESPRWLLSVGRIEEAEVIVKKAAKENDRPLPENWKLHPISEGQAKKGTVFDLFSSVNMATKTLILFYAWFTNSFVYYGLTLSCGSLGGSLMINYLLNGLMEIPAYSVCTWILLNAGRKKCYVSLMTAGGLSLFAIMGIPLNYFQYNWPAIVLSLIGKMCITGKVYRFHISF